MAGPLRVSSLVGDHWLPFLAMHREDERATADRWLPVLAFATVAVVLVVVVWISVANLGLASIPTSTGPRWRAYPAQPWFDGWARFDAGWYARIARDGYGFHGPNGQSPTAFFPAYPLLMRAVGSLTGDVMLAGILVTGACGLGVAVTFFAWCRDRLGPRTARYALAALLLYPFSYYLVGAVYGDALFLFMALLAFLLLERDEPWLAGVAGAVATAARPVGAALVIGLLIRTLERRGVLDAWFAEPGDPAGTVGGVALAQRRRSALRLLRGRDLGVLISAAGLLGYCGYLFSRFGDPLAFAEAMEGWKQPASVSTWLKFDVFDALAHGSFEPFLAKVAVHAALTVGALFLVPRIVRRLGWGYGTYVLVIVLFPALSTKDFVGMARYVLAAFPCFAVVGELLARQPRPARLVLAASGAMLVVFTSMYARWYYLS
jgi:hypothetical protein